MPYFMCHSVTKFIKPNTIISLNCIKTTWAAETQIDLYKENDTNFMLTNMQFLMG